MVATALPGYAGKVLYVDLTSGASREEALDPEWARTLIGGWGINNRLAYDLVPPQVDPYAPENLIILGTGPFVGTMVPGGAEVLATTKFPQNNAFATAAGGGSFALMLKSAGYDHVVISGRARSPVYLAIGGRGPELRNAQNLWGKDAFEVDDDLHSRHEPCGVIAMGPAGENLVRFSIASVDKGGTLGRGGLASVMGSKNLKAIVALQGSQRIEVAHRVKLERLLNALHERVMAWPGRKILLEHGMGELEGDLQQVHCRHRQVVACPSCPVAEKERITLKDGPYAGLTTYMPHFNPVELGCRTASEAYGQAVKYLDTLNRLGLCRVSFGDLLSWLVRLHREGIITVEDTGGVEPREDLDTALRLMEMVAFREGFGDVLAEGPVGAAGKIGRGAADYLAHVKGQSIVWDPREKGLGTMEFEEIVNPRGSHVASGGSPSYATGRPLEDFVRHSERMGATPEAVKRIVGPTSFNPGRLTRYSEDWFSLFNCLGLCNRAHVNRFYSAKLMAELFTAVTGMEVTPQEVMKAAERAWTLGKMLNVRVGFDRKDDRAPEAWFQPLKGPAGERHLTDYYGAPLGRADVDRLLDDYYDERGWDRKSGTPTGEKLEELGLAGG